MDPDQTAPTGLVHTVCLGGFKYFSGRQNIHCVIMHFKN